MEIFLHRFGWFPVQYYYKAPTFARNVETAELCRSHLVISTGPTPSPSTPFATAPPPTSAPSPGEGRGQCRTARPRPKQVHITFFISPCFVDQTVFKHLNCVCSGRRRHRLELLHLLRRRAFGRGREPGGGPERQRNGDRDRIRGPPGKELGDVMIKKSHTLHGFFVQVFVLQGTAARPAWGWTPPARN